MSQPIKLFLAYAREDEAFKDELVKHLTALHRQGLISIWHDQAIEPGSRWENVIEENLQSADIILLLVSADFIASDYAYNIEMKKAIGRHEVGSAVVIPVILRPCRWKGAPFGKLQALPKDGKPVTHWPNPDDAWDNVVEAIEKRVEEIERQKARWAELDNFINNLDLGDDE